MKKLLLTILLLAPGLAFAKNQPLIFTEVPASQINDVCNYKGTSTELGCFYGNGVNKIFTVATASSSDKTFTLLHEEGHYLLECADLSRFNTRTNTIDSSWSDPHEAAASLFALYTMYNGSLTTPQDNSFFKKAAHGKYLCKGNKRI